MYVDEEGGVDVNWTQTQHVPSRCRLRRKHHFIFTQYGDEVAANWVLSQNLVLVRKDGYTIA